MATYTQDFAGYTTGVTPSGWTNQWAAWSPTVETGGADQELVSTPPDNARRALTYDAAGTFTDGQVLSLGKVSGLPATGANSLSTWRIMARVTGSAGNETGVYAQIGFDSLDDDIRLTVGEYAAGAFSGLASSGDLGLANDVYYWVRFDLSGSTIRAKIWQDGTAEPAWGGAETVSATTSVTSSGAAGVGNFSGDGSDTSYWDYTSFATTDAETAPSPSALTVSLTLEDASGSPQANLSNLKWAWFDEDRPDIFTTPPDKGTDSTDGNGLLEVDLPNTTLTTGDTGVLVVFTSDGTVTGAYPITL